MSQQVIGSAVNIFSCNNMIAILCKVLNGISYRCCSRGNGKGCESPLQCCNSPFKYILGRVGKSSVNIACIRQIKPCCRMLAVMKYIRGCLVNRDCSGIGNRICLFLTNV